MTPERAQHVRMASAAAVNSDNDSEVEWEDASPPPPPPVEAVGAIGAVEAVSGKRKAALISDDDDDDDDSSAAAAVPKPQFGGKKKKSKTTRTKRVVAKAKVYGDNSFFELSLPIGINLLVKPIDIGEQRAPWTSTDGDLLSKPARNKAIIAKKVDFGLENTLWVLQMADGRSTICAEFTF